MEDEIERKINRIFLGVLSDERLGIKTLLKCQVDEKERIFQNKAQNFKIFTWCIFVAIANAG